MRAAVLWTGLSGYLDACLRELATRREIELSVTYRVPGTTDPFREESFAWIQHRRVWHSHKELEGLDAEIRRFAPELLLLAGWHVPAYRQVARALQGNVFRVMAMDNCWNGTLRQRAAIAFAPRFLHPLADAVWVPGEPQVLFARQLGYQPHQILRGLYSGDVEAFKAAHSARIAFRRPLHRTFVFVGRLVVQKGIRTLLRAYRLYRSRCATPWPLICCGTGPLASLLNGTPGVHPRGFVQPKDLPHVMAEAGCLILPSHFEPWGVVLHEAAASGLLIIASEKVGASLELLQAGDNGFIFRDGDAEALSRLLLRVSTLSDARLDIMSQLSHQISGRFSPQRWADTLLDRYDSVSSGN